MRFAGYSRHTEESLLHLYSRQTSLKTDMNTQTNRKETRNDNETARETEDVLSGLCVHCGSGA
jgi:hypothetical protein